MSKIWLVGAAAIVMAMGATSAQAVNVSAKKIFIKDNTSPTKRQVMVLSNDAAVHFSDAIAPDTNGASLHLYSATDDFCVVLAGGPEWTSKNNKVWKYKNKATKNTAQIKNGKLLVAIKSGVTYTLADNGSQTPVNAQVQFGTGTRFCMRCASAKKNDAKKFLAKDCAATACDAEPSSCGQSAGTTTTTVTGTTVAGATTTSSTTIPSGGSVLKGALTATPGRFNYNATLGLPGADAACNTNFAGTHHCTLTELQSAESAGDLTGLKDIGSNTVTSFWAIDGSADPLQQCKDDAVGGSNLNWEYGTAHTVSRGSKVALTNATGALGSVQTGLQCNLSGNSWVGCCQ